MYDAQFFNVNFEPFHLSTDFRERRNSKMNISSISLYKRSSRCLCFSMSLLTKTRCYTSRKHKCRFASKYRFNARTRKILIKFWFAYEKSNRLSFVCTRITNFEIHHRAPEKYTESPCSKYICNIFSKKVFNNKQLKNSLLAY